MSRRWWCRPATYLAHCAALPSARSAGSLAGAAHGTRLRRAEAVRTTPRTSCWATAAMHVEVVRMDARDARQRAVAVASAWATRDAMSRVEMQGC